MYLRIFPLVALGGLLAACGGGEGGPGGNLTLAVTDAPVDDARRVVIAFTGVELKPQDGSAVNFNFAPRQIDLLALSGGNSELLLAGVDVPTGAYTSARLKISAAEDSVLDSYIELATDGSQHELSVPDDATAGLRHSGSFVVPENGRADFTIDFDLRRSVHGPGGDFGAYQLRPVLRFVNNAQQGAIAGTADPSLLTAGCRPAVYVFSGADVTPDDVDGQGDPLTSAIVDRNTTGFTAAFLPPGTYTAAFTCEADVDQPGNDDSISFIESQNASVQAGQTARISFPSQPSPGLLPGV